MNIQVKDFQNLEDGFAELESNGKYKAVILDAKALIKPDQETEDFDFLPLALHRLEKLNQKTGRIHTPFAVITGYYDNFRSFDTLIKEQKGRLFDKSSQEEEMLQYLLNEIENAENTKIEKQFADVFEVFDKGYLDSEKREDLLEIVKKLDNPSQLKNNFNPLRKILEAIYEKLKNKGLIPNEIYGNLEWTWRYLSGMSVNIGTRQNPNNLQVPAMFPPHISKNIKTVEELSSTISHNYSENVTIYAYKSAVFALLEVLLWFKNLMEKP